MTAIDRIVLKDAVSKRTAYILENKECVREDSNFDGFGLRQKRLTAAVLQNYNDE